MSKWEPHETEHEISLIIIRRLARHVVRMEVRTVVFSVWVSKPGGKRPF
jgi:hypothetical protein